ncbi:MAG: acyltransferase [Chitinophagaceae bacterium]|nr:acyltransferase [Chitinophagaceae bacterium]
MDTKATSETFHLNGLNGLRAIAALSVVITHIVQGLEYFGLPRMYGLDMAGYGVTLFFTLSGFLITYLLLLEKRKVWSYQYQAVLSEKDTADLAAVLFVFDSCCSCLISL